MSVMSWGSKYRNTSAGLLLLRIATGLIFVVHGYGKLFGNMPSMSMFTGMIAHMGFPFPAFFAWVVALAEFFGGIALILGVFTCFFAAVLAVDMLVAFGAVMGLSISKGGLEFLLLLSMIALMLTGPGKLSLGYKLKMKKIGADDKSCDESSCNCGTGCGCGSGGCGSSGCCNDAGSKEAKH